MTRITHKRQKLIGTVLFLLVLVVWYVAQIPCWIRAWFHIPCPGCGMTRAWLSLLRGDLSAAFLYHPLFWTAPLLYGYVLFNGKPFANRWLNRAGLLLLAAGFIALEIFRLLSAEQRQLFG